MTIHNDYTNTADWVAGFAHRGEPIPATTAAVLAHTLMDLAERVRHIENVPLWLDAPEVRLGFHKLRERHDAE